MTKMLEIKSKGLMQKEALSLIGASTKSFDDDKIGQFGSGLPYSLASMVRQKVDFMIFSGKDEIRINTVEVEFGGKKFNQLTVNGEKTSFVDSMGQKDWNGAFPFIREIYSNALDEDENASIKLVDKIEPEDGYTKYYIVADSKVSEVAENISNYFINQKEASFTGKRGSIYLGGESGVKIYRKGILVFEDLEQNSIFTYNLQNININESRVLSNIYEARTEIGRLIESCTNKSVLRTWIRVLGGGNYGKMEYDCFLPSWMSTQHNPELIDVLLENKYYVINLRDLLEKEDVDGRIGLPQDALLRFMVYAPDIDVIGLNSQSQNKVKDAYKKLDKPSISYSDKVANAIAFLMKTDYKHRLDAEVKCVKFFNNNVLGKAENGVILLSEKLRDYSTDEVAKVIIEEQEHIISGQGDETRNFQNHLFNLYFEQLKTQCKDEY